MSTVLTVATIILRYCPTLTTMKLHKLCFYAQAHTLATTGLPLFDEPFEAWRNGPGCPELFRHHRGMFLIHDGELADPRPRPPTGFQYGLVRQVCDTLGGLSSNQLTRRAQHEQPWMQARQGLAPAEQSRRPIPAASMLAFYQTHPPISPD